MATRHSIRGRFDLWESNRSNATIAEIAADFVALYNQGAFEQIGQKYWSADVTSIEAMAGPMARVEGLNAVIAKSAWWEANNEIHSTSCTGPYVNGDQFAVRFAMDVTDKSTGNRTQMDEVGVYTVRNGKIIEERFFY